MCHHRVAGVAFALGSGRRGAFLRMHVRKRGGGGGALLGVRGLCGVCMCLGRGERWAGGQGGGAKPARKGACAHHGWDGCCIIITGPGRCPPSSSTTLYGAMGLNVQSIVTTQPNKIAPSVALGRLSSWPVRHPPSNRSQAGRERERGQTAAGMRGAAGRVAAARVLLPNA